MLVEKYPQSTEAPAAAWSAGKLYEQAALWDQAARFYQTLADRYPKDTHAADALFNAGLLARAPRRYAGAPSPPTRQYAQRYKTRDDVKQVAFRVGVVYAEAGQHEAAARAFGDYALQLSGRRADHRGLLAPGRRAHRRRAGQARRRSRSRRRWRSTSAAATRRRAGAAAHARYLEGEVMFRDFERVKLASRSAQAQAHARREVEAAREGQGRPTSTW